MKPKHLQAWWEVVAHLISGTLLLFYIYAPSFRFLTWFLIIEWVVGVINTVLWWRWVNSVDPASQSQEVTRG